jgi:hypothetical protein
VQSGVLQMTDSGALTTSGHLSVASGATFYLNRTTVTTGSTFSGTGLLYMPGTTTITGTVTFTIPSQLTNALTGSGTLRLGAPMSWDAGTVTLAGGLEVLNGQTLTMPGNGNTRVLSATSLRNHGTVAMFNPSALLWAGSTTVAVTNESDGLWTFASGTFTFTANGAGTLSFTNAGTMQGSSTTLNVSTFIGYTNTGTITGITVQFF